MKAGSSYVELWQNMRSCIGIGDAEPGALNIDDFDCLVTPLLLLLWPCKGLAV
jgi:hypothetical protein